MSEVELVMSPELAEILGEGEHPIWIGRPVLIPFLVPYLPLMMFGLPFLMIPLFMMLAGGLFGLIILVMPHFWVGLALFLSPIYGAMLRKRTLYAVTER